MSSTIQTASAGAPALPADAASRSIRARETAADADTARELVIVNHSALRSSKDLVERLRERCPGAVFSEPVDATSLLGAEAKAFDTMTIAGGDGTLCRFLPAILGADLPVRLVPCGTANDLAAEMGIPRGPDALATGPAGMRERPVDVVVAGQAPFTTVGFLGFGSDVVRAVNQLRTMPWLRPFLALLGTLVYVLGVVWIGFLRPLKRYRLKVRAERGEFEVETPLVVACNQPRVGGTMNLAAGTENDDGHFRLLVFRQHSGWHLLRAIFALCRGVPPAAAGVESFETASVDLTSLDGQPFMFCADGEELVFDTRVTLSVHPRRLRLLVPRS